MSTPNDDELGFNYENDAVRPDPDYDWGLSLCSDNRTAAMEYTSDIPDIDDSY